MATSLALRAGGYLAHARTFSGVGASANVSIHRCLEDLTGVMTTLSETSTHVNNG